MQLKLTAARVRGCVSARIRACVRVHEYVNALFERVSHANPPLRLVNFCASLLHQLRDLSSSVHAQSASEQRRSHNHLGAGRRQIH